MTPDPPVMAEQSVAAPPEDKATGCGDRIGCPHHSGTTTATAEIRLSYANTRSDHLPVTACHYSAPPSRHLATVACHRAAWQPPVTAFGRFPSSSSLASQEGSSKAEDHPTLPAYLDLAGACNCRVVDYTFRAKFGGWDYAAHLSNPTYESLSVMTLARGGYYMALATLRRTRCIPRSPRGGLPGRAGYRHIHG